MNSHIAHPQTTMSEYDRGRLDERERAISLIRDKLLGWGHHGAPDCAVCIAAGVFVYHIKSPEAEGSE